MQKSRKLPDAGGKSPLCEVKEQSGMLPGESFCDVARKESKKAVKIEEMPNNHHLEHPEIIDRYHPWSKELPETYRLKR